MIRVIYKKKEILFILFSSIIVVFTSAHYDFFELIAEFSSRHEKWEIDELMTLAIYLAFILGVLSYKKSKALEKEIHERILVEKELEIALNHAENANRFKSEFLANMSHELRTPLNSIIGFSDILISGEGKVDKQRVYLNHISTSGKHLLSLINDILDLSKVEAGKMKLNYEIFDIYSAIFEIKQLVIPLADKKQIDIDFIVDECLGEICADKMRFKQILFNLISNAIKFTSANGTITIIAHTIDRILQCTVEDTGIGISEENKKKMFKPFTQFDSSTNRSYEGTGLGLSLIKKFVELHQGKIWFESELGKGTAFTFELPLKPI